MTARCTKSWCSTAFRPGCRGSLSYASATISAAPSTILRRRKIARYTPKKIERLMQDAGIVRNRAKIEGAVGSARAWLKIMDIGPGFSDMLWKHVDGRPIDHKLGSRARTPTESAESRAMSKELLGHGFKFVGPTIVYAFMQAVGMVNDHLVDCHRHAAVAKLGKRK